jgi:hypothetical protein
MLFQHKVKNKKYRHDQIIVGCASGPNHFRVFDERIYPKFHQIPPILSRWGVRDHP